jgi:glucose/arabinose dehydrogenase
MRSHGALALVLALSSFASPSHAVEARRIATGLDHPVFVAAPAGDPRLFVVEQTGHIRVVSDAASGEVLATPFLDLTDRIFIFDFYDEERGLLGLAFPPDFATSGFFYVQYTETGSFPDPGDVIVARFHVSADPNVADPSSEALIFSMAKPAAQPGTTEAYHNGGSIAFGPDGRLWMPTGDGAGWFGDDGNDCAQNAGSPLGKLLRIDLAQVPPGGVVVPSGAACPQLPATNAIEIWARGLRNPYRTSFDRLTGDLYVADVGQDAREEVDVVAASALSGAGPNFGWRAFEGSIANPAVCPGDPLCSQIGTTRLPTYEYPHVGNGCEGSITGGYVYRGPDPAIQGHYFFADFCQGFIRSFVWDGANGVTNVVDRTAELTPDAGSIDVVTGFGEGGDGALYLVDWLDGELYAVPEPSAALLAAAALVTLVTRRSSHSRPGPLFTGGRSGAWLRRG